MQTNVANFHFSSRPLRPILHRAADEEERDGARARGGGQRVRAGAPLGLQPAATGNRLENWL